MKKVLSAVLAVGLLLGQPLLCGAESLWQDNKRSSIFQDVKARTVGDILTIVISETSNATRSGKADNSKKASLDLKAGVGSLLDWITRHNASMSDSFQSSGSLTNTSKLSANLTVQVVGVQPNGNLLLSGSQSIRQNRDIQTITVTGEVRPQDISASNTVLSSYIANAQIAVTGKGPIMRKQRQGIITQVLNFLF